MDVPISFGHRHALASSGSSATKAKAAIAGSRNELQTNASSLEKRRNPPPYSHLRVVCQPATGWEDIASRWDSCTLPRIKTKSSLCKTNRSDYMSIPSSKKACRYDSAVSEKQTSSKSPPRSTKQPRVTLQRSRLSMPL
jgi:hypothetical protein